MKYPSQCPSHPHLNWREFVNGEVNDEIGYRKALESCECCLQLFAASLEINLESPPPGFVDKVMTGLPQIGISQMKNKRPWQPLLHYATAACITFALVHLGYFDYIINIPGELQHLENSSEAGSHVQSIIDTFKSLIDFIIVKGV